MDCLIPSCMLVIFPLGQPLINSIPGRHTANMLLESAVPLNMTDEFSSPPHREGERDSLFSQHAYSKIYNFVLFWSVVIIMCMILKNLDKEKERIWVLIFIAINHYFPLF